jgi:hypothetical protein
MLSGQAILIFLGGQSDTGLHGGFRSSFPKTLCSIRIASMPEENFLDFYLTVADVPQNVRHFFDSG